MKSLLIATTNPGKFAEASAVFAGDGVKIFSLKDFLGIEPVFEISFRRKNLLALKPKIIEYLKER